MCLVSSQGGGGPFGAVACANPIDTSKNFLKFFTLDSQSKTLLTCFKILLIFWFHPYKSHSIMATASQTQTAASQTAGQSIWEAVKRTPGLIAGGPVDLANLAIGLITGKGLQGVSKKPIGGSEWVNEFFGMPQSKDALQQGTEAALSMLSPGGIAKAMFVPAFAIKTLGEVKKAEKLINQGMAEEAWKQYGIYQDPADRILKSVVSDAPATVRPEAIARGDVTVVKNKFTGKEEYSLVPDYTRTYLENRPPVTAQEIFYHPDLYKLVPEIAQAQVRGGGFPGSGSYSPENNVIWLGGGESLQDFVSTFLHEAAGHGAQYKYGMAAGGSPEMFIADEKTFRGAQKTLRDAQKMLRVPPGSREAVPESVKNTLANYEKVLRDAENLAGEYYYRLPGEASARAIQQMYKIPALAQENPLSVMNTELLAKLGGPATPLANYTLVPPVDTLPEVKAITDNISILYDNLLKGWAKP